MVYIFTISNKNYGIGHLSRILNLIILGRFFHLLIIYTDEDYKNNIIKFIKSKEEKYKIFFNFKIINSNIKEFIYELNINNSDTIIIDGREFYSKFIPLLNKLNVKLISWDDYSLNSKNYSNIKINSLPNYKNDLSNFSGIIYNPFSLELYKKIKRIKECEKNTILISFGGSDPANIAEKVINAIYDNKNYKITIVKGPLANYSSLNKFKNINIIENNENILDFIENNEIIFTTAGITMLEALLLKKKVILINPTKYHNKIAKTLTNIFNLGYYKNVKNIDIINSINKIKEINNEFIEIDKEKYLSWINEIINNKLDNNYYCPVCFSYNRIVLDRNDKNTLFKCKNCNSNYLYIIKEIEKKYNEDYFFENHIKKYGKSYIEDENNIREFSRRRLKNIRNLLNNNENKTLLDIGSALGIFLDEAKNYGFYVKGCEISKFARDYCKERFNIDSYDNIYNINEKFDVITLWFVLEHFINPGEIIKKISSLMNKNGIIGISCPNGSGAYAIFNKNSYFKNRPIEHYFEPTIKGLKILLEKNNFKIEKIEIFGLHPERYFMPDVELIKNIQKFLKLGDTFEIYARKL